MELAPGKFDDQIVMGLVPSNLSDDSHSYEALSYVWGTAIAPRNAVINGIPTKITSNLDSALRHLRGTIVKRTLWVDAVSMDQRNTQERNHQVQIMGKIYSTAREVIVWLGPVASNDLNLRAVLGAMQFQFASGNPSTSTLFDYMTSVVSLMKEQAGANVTGDIDVLDSIYSIISRPWFSRLWVVQELALSKRAVVRLGNFTFPWQPFQSFIQWLPGHKVNSSVYPRLAEVAPRVCKMARSRLFSSQLFRTIHLSASDPRDKVFGILGISSFEDSTIEPDYTKSTQQVYIDAACSALLNSKLAMYYHAPLQTYSDEPRAISEKLFGMPSWVPDFSIEGATYVDKTIQCGSTATYYGRADHRPFTILDGTLFPASTERFFRRMVEELPIPPLQVSEDRTRLQVPGILIGTVTKTSGRLLWDMDRVETSTGLPQCVHEIFQTMVEPEGISAMSFVEHIIRPRSAIERFEGYKRDAALHLLKPLARPPNPSPKLQRAMQELVDHIKGNVYKRIFFATSSGEFGLTYHPDPIHGVRPGDVVVGLFGLNFPFLLRPNDDKTWTMINVVGITSHTWGHTFLMNTETIMNTYDHSGNNWKQFAHVPKGENTGTWKDYEEYGMEEYVIV